MLFNIRQEKIVLLREMKQLRIVCKGVAREYKIILESLFYT